MEAYLKNVNKLTKQFDQFELTCIPKRENTFVDALAALTSTSDPEFTRIMPVKMI